MPQYVAKVVYRFEAFDDAEARKMVNQLISYPTPGEAFISIPIVETTEVRALQHGSCENILSRGFK